MTGATGANATSCVLSRGQATGGQGQAKKEMKTCSKCKGEFEATQEYFYKHKINSSGVILLKGRCKKCCQPLKKIEKEKARKNSKIYYDKNKEKICKQKKMKRDIKKGINI